jgi:hypothetical protein
MSRECVTWSAKVIATENSKNFTRRRILGLSSHSPAPTSPRQANVPLPACHFLPFQSSHSAIEIPPIFLKTTIEEFVNRHTLHNCDDRSRILKETLEGEEKAPVRPSLLANPANRYTRKLKIR